MTVNATVAHASGGILASFALALALTLVVELAVAALAFGLRTRRELGIVVLANVITNPALNLMLMFAATLAGSRALAEPALAAVLAALELAAMFVEWRILIWALPEHEERTLGISLTVNTASLAVGLALHALGIW